MFSLLFSLLVFNSPSHATPVSDLRDYLASKTFVIEKPLMGFNYNDLPREPATAAQFSALLKLNAEEFFNEASKVDYTVGPGLYLATGAYGSRVVFGKEDPRLSAVVIRGGTKFLNTRLFDDPSEKQIQIKILKALGCYSADDSFIWRLRYHAEPECKRLFLGTVRELSIDGIIYLWGDREKLEGCPDLDTVAFNIISADAVDVSKSNYYSDRLKIENDVTSSGFVARLYKESIGAQGYGPKMLIQGNGEYHGPKFLMDTAGSKSPANYSELKAKFIWSCSQPIQ